MLTTVSSHREFFKPSRTSFHAYNMEILQIRMPICFLYCLRHLPKGWPNALYSKCMGSVTLRLFEGPRPFLFLDPQLVVVMRTSVGTISISEGYGGTSTDHFLVSNVWVIILFVTPLFGVMITNYVLLYLEIIVLICIIMMLIIRSLHLGNNFISEKVHCRWVPEWIWIKIYL